MEHENRDEVVQNMVEDRPDDVPLDLIHKVDEQKVSELKRMIGEEDDETELDETEVENSDIDVILSARV